MKVDYSQIDKFPQSYHDEINEDGKRLAHPGYKMIECTHCHQGFVQSKQLNFTLCSKCGVHEE